MKSSLLPACVLFQPGDGGGFDAFVSAFKNGHARSSRTSAEVNLPIKRRVDSLVAWCRFFQVSLFAADLRDLGCGDLNSACGLGDRIEGVQRVANRHRTGVAVVDAC